MDERQQQIIRIATSLRELNQNFYQATRKDAEACGITQIQYLALRLLRQYPNISLNELADHMHTGASAASGVVDRLVQAGYIAREKTEADRRAVAIQLTPAGDELLGRTGERILRRLSPLLELSEEDIGHLLRIHGQMIDILQRVREEK